MTRFAILLPYRMCVDARNLKEDVPGVKVPTAAKACHVAAVDMRRAPSNTDSRRSEAAAWPAERVKPTSGPVPVSTFFSARPGRPRA
jgi:hypothetical protein